MTTRPKRPRDTNQLAKLIMDISTGAAIDVQPKESARAVIGRVGGLKGGIARAKVLSPDRRIKIAKKAAKVRWKKNPVTT